MAKWKMVVEVVEDAEIAVVDEELEVVKAVEWRVLEEEMATREVLGKELKNTEMGAAATEAE